MDKVGKVMDRLISLQAVIDEIDEWIKAFRENGHKESAADACLIQDGIIQLPSAQPYSEEEIQKMQELEQAQFDTMYELGKQAAEPHWIPCSEPPTEHGFYHEILLYGKDGNYAVGWYDEDYFTWDDRFDMDTPVAWCKLPEPWKGEQE